MKKISYLIFMLFCYTFVLTNVSAATASVKVSAYTVTAGSSVTITTTVSSNKTIFFIEGTLSCSGAGVSKSQNLAFDNSSNNVYSKSYYLTVNPTTTGKITCTTKNLKVIDASANSWQNIGSKSTNITVREKSANNYLSSLTIDGYNLDKEFNKDTLDYSVTVKEGTEKITVSAKSADGYAKVSGIGTLNVSEGMNNFSIVVTAENGSKRTYNLSVDVKEFEPIKVQVDGSEYSVVRKRKSLPKVSEYFIDKDVIITDNNIAVAALRKLNSRVFVFTESLLFI